MKKSLFLMLIALLVLPAFLPWMPHDAAHTLHDYKESHHQNRKKSDRAAHIYRHDVHDHDTQIQADDHHSINLDVVTYFGEYLHIDIQKPGLVILKAPTPDSHDFVLIFPTTIEPQARYELASVQSRAPPDWRWHRPDNTPLYLSTQRLRI